MYIMDHYYIILILPTILLSLWAQFKVKSTFTHFSHQNTIKAMTGAQAAAYLLKVNNIHDVKIEQIAGSLTDHYDPSSKILRLSTPVYGQTSISAVGVAAHETGHAIQHAIGYAPLGLRSTLVPIANIGSTIGSSIAIAGLIFSLPFLLNIGIILFAGAVLFYVITLPVEFDASRRAIAILGKTNTLTADELKGVKKVLGAAAMTYVASALTAIMSIVRLILLSRNKNN